jgi:hypothetical protein
MDLINNNLNNGDTILNLTTTHGNLPTTSGNTIPHINIHRSHHQTTATTTATTTAATATTTTTIDLYGIDDACVATNSGVLVNGNNNYITTTNSMYGDYIYGLPSLTHQNSSAHYLNMPVNTTVGSFIHGSYRSDKRKNAIVNTANSGQKNSSNKNSNKNHGTDHQNNLKNRPKEQENKQNTMEVIVNNKIINNDTFGMDENFNQINSLDINKDNKNKPIESKNNMNNNLVQKKQGYDLFYAGNNDDNFYGDDVDYDDYDSQNGY